MSMDGIEKTGYGRFFESQTIFLTGSTGSLGGCLLYKLALQLPTRKIFVHIRRSPQTAVDKWMRWMPQQTQAILNTGKVHFVVGDMVKPDFGIEDGAMIERLRNEVTVVIHAAANISFAASVKDAVEYNCLPPLELAHMASQFRRLKQFIQLSTAYVNSFLPDGYVGEQWYSASDDDPEDEIAAVLSSGDVAHSSSFSSTYAYAKYLMERLFVKRYPLLPLLLVRPTIFGAALRDPYMLYGPPNSTPMRKFAEFYLADHGTQVWHAAEGYKSGANVLDEIPVDFVANAVLLHAAAKTQGIVQIGSQLYVPMTFDDFLELAAANAPPETRKDLPTVVFTQDRSVPQHFLAELVKAATRNWGFDCGRSYWLKQIPGPLSLSVCRHEVDALNLARMEEIYRDMRRTVKL